MPLPLSYGRSERVPIPIAAWALLAGCLSGPLSFAFMVASLYLRFPPGLALAATAAPLVSTIIFCCGVYHQVLRRPVVPKHRDWVAGGIFASIAWVAIIFLAMILLPSLH